MTGIFTLIAEKIRSDIAGLQRNQVNVNEYVSREQDQLPCYPVVIVGNLNPGNGLLSSTEFENYAGVIDISAEHTDDSEALKLAFDSYGLLNGFCSDPIGNMGFVSLAGTKNSDGVYQYTLSFNVSINLA